MARTTEKVIEVQTYKPRTRRKMVPRKRVVAKKDKVRRPKQKTLSQLKKELEALQKKLVIKLYGNDCFTCNAKNLEGKNCQLGHVPWPRTILSIYAKFDPQFTRIQCMVCNVHRGGMGAVALQKMQEQGLNTDFMWDFAQQDRGRPVPRSWFEEQIKIFSEKLNGN